MGRPLLAPLCSLLAVERAVSPSECKDADMLREVCSVGRERGHEEPEFRSQVSVRRPPPEGSLDQELGVFPCRRAI